MTWPCCFLLQPMNDATLLYVAAMLNRMIWPYSYGRKCFRAKLQKVSIPVPMVDGEIDEQTIAKRAKTVPTLSTQ